MACASDCFNPLRIKHDDYLKKKLKQIRIN